MFILYVTQWKSILFQVSGSPLPLSLPHHHMSLFYTSKSVPVICCPPCLPQTMFSSAVLAFLLPLSASLFSLFVLFTFKYLLRCSPHAVIFLLLLKSKGFIILRPNVNQIVPHEPLTAWFKLLFSWPSARLLILTGTFPPVLSSVADLRSRVMQFFISDSLDSCDNLVTSTVFSPYSLENMPFLLSQTFFARTQWLGPVSCGWQLMMMTLAPTRPSRTPCPANSPSIFGSTR